MLHHTTALIAKCFRERDITFTIEQRGPYSSVNVNLVPEVPVPGNMLRIISSEDSVHVYIFDTNTPICDEDMPGYVLACNELNRVIPHLKFYIHNKVFTARYEIPSCIGEDQLGEHCFFILEEIKKAYPAVSRIFIKWLTPQNSNQEDA